VLNIGSKLIMKKYGFNKVYPSGTSYLAPQTY